MKEISTSILSNESLPKLIEKLNDSKTDYIHLDIMDNKFVPNKFLSVSELSKILDKIEKKIDVHLMVNNPEPYIKKLALYNISYITIHYEIPNFYKYIEMIKNYGLKVGLSIKPETSIKEIYPYLNEIDLVLIMSVNPGLSGQEFIKETETKINALKEEIKTKNYNVKISVDGGINDEVLPYVTNADMLVSCSYVLKDLNNIDKLKN